MMNLEGLQLETGGATGIGEESWAVSDDGSLRHHRTGIFIGEGGLRDGRTAQEFTVSSNDIQVNQSNLLGQGAGGIVCQGLHVPTGKVLAVKIV
mmetsp:Transcript_21080/g.62919  ORF Transcript_21080/g.62919 Transcript_21080/m.62919 type:complete len:94 (+) Transcript_21080:1-282(+)